MPCLTSTSLVVVGILSEMVSNRVVVLKDFLYVGLSKHFNGFHTVVVVAGNFLNAHPAGVGTERSFITGSLNSSSQNMAFGHSVAVGEFDFVNRSNRVRLMT